MQISEFARIAQNYAVRLSEFVRNRCGRWVRTLRSSADILFHSLSVLFGSEMPRQQHHDRT
jgi:hypothetical protein